MKGSSHVRVLVGVDEGHGGCRGAVAFALALAGVTGAHADGSPTAFPYDLTAQPRYQQGVPRCAARKESARS